MKRVGLFVGVDRYKDIGITQLRCAVKDATSLMASFSKAQYDNVESLLNDDARCEDILSKAENMVESLNSGDLFVFYFSGHGREFGSSHYLIGPTGRANAELYQVGSLSLSSLVAVTNKPGVNRLFILDCCRSNLLADRSGSFSCSVSRNIALNELVQGNSNKNIIPPLILNSCSTGEQAFEKEDHGFFTEALLKSIESRKVASFQDFQRSLLITGTPKPQNVSWNGNLLHWEKISLFKHWDESQQVNPNNFRQTQNISNPDRYIYEDLVQEVSALVSHYNISDENLRMALNRAERAANDKDYTSAVYFLKQAKKIILDWKEQKISETPKSNPVYSNNEYTSTRSDAENYEQEAKNVKKYVWFGILTPIVTIIALHNIATIRKQMRAAGNYQGQEYLDSAKTIAWWIIAVYVLIILVAS